MQRVLYAKGFCKPHIYKNQCNLHILKTEIIQFLARNTIMTFAVIIPFYVILSLKFCYFPALLSLFSLYFEVFSHYWQLIPSIDRLAISTGCWNCEQNIIYSVLEVFICIIGQTPQMHLQCTSRWPQMHLHQQARRSQCTSLYFWLALICSSNAPLSALGMCWVKQIRNVVNQIWFLSPCAITKHMHHSIIYH